MCEVHCEKQQKYCEWDILKIPFCRGGKEKYPGNTKRRKTEGLIQNVILQLLPKKNPLVGAVHRAALASGKCCTARE